MHKTIDRIGCIALAVMLLITVAVWAGKAAAGKQETVTVGYEGLFDTSVVHTIDIEMADWDGFIANAMQEEYRECAVTIDGEKISNVAIRAKGNTSLSSVASLNSQKYSFKIEFDQFVKGRTYRGLDKLSLNNLIYDATMMKDYLAYTLMGKMGVPSPLCSYVQITVNGELWGLYLAVEGVEDGFLERNNMTSGELYKPDSMSFGGGRGNGRDFDFEQFRVKDDDSAETNETTDQPAAEATETPAKSFGNPFGSPPSGSFPGQMPEGMTLPEGLSLSEGFSMPQGMTPPDGFAMPGSTESSEKQSGDGKFSFGGGMFNFGMGSSDVRLKYTDDDPDSYANIFNNAKTDVGKKDKARLIQTLKTLNSENAQDAVFTDEVIRYLAVHDFLQNGDSYTGMMVHNYYLYEENGKLAILPWDYNLAFGGMSGSDASSTVNSPIDSPVSTSTASDRPLIAWIFEDEEATAAYHEVYSQFVADIIESGWLESEIARVAALIRPYVEADANSFYSAEEFDAAIEALQSYCALRRQSVRGQLDGTIPSTSQAQRADSSALVDVGSLSISAMGSMNTGGGGGGGPAMPGNSFPGGNFQMPGGSEGQSRDQSSAFSPGTMPGASWPGGQNSAAAAQPDATAQPINVEQADAAKQAEATAKSAADERKPQGDFSFPMDAQQSAAKGMSWITFALFAALLIAAIVLVSRLPGRER